MEGKHNSGNQGIGFVGLLAIAFIVLKLLHVIEWPWLWVLAPLWISAAISIVILIVVVIITILSHWND